MAETFANGDYFADGTIRATGDTDDLNVRMYQEDFVANESFLLRTSVTHRPDAVSLDYLTCFTLGPKGFTDTSEGLVKYVWKIWADSVAVYIARVNETGDDWGETQTLFTYAGVPIIEVDAAFDQNGNVVVCAERHSGYKKTPYVWIYYFDSFNGSYLFVPFAPGRNPRALLDDPDDFVNSDVLIFYVEGTKEQRVVYRMQRDRYQIVYNSPIVKELGEFYDYYLEDIARTIDNRIVIVYARRDKTRGEYQFLRWESSLYPFTMPAEGLTVNDDLLSSSELLRLVKFVETTDSTYELPPEYDASIVSDALSMTGEILDGNIVLPLIVVSPGIDVDPDTIVFITDIEGVTSNAGIESGLLAQPLITLDAFDNDALSHTSVISSGTNVKIVIEFFADVTEEDLTHTSTISSGTLV